MAFKDDIDKYIAKYNMLIDTTFQKACRKISNDIAEETPVSTGKLLGSWSPSVDGISNFNYEGGPSAWSVDERGWKKDESIANANRAAAMGSLSGRITSTTSALDRKRNYFFTNDTPYVKNAEHDGWLKTGPYRMREKAVLNWQAIVNEAAIG